MHKLKSIALRLHAHYSDGKSIVMSHVLNVHLIRVVSGTGQTGEIMAALTTERFFTPITSAVEHDGMLYLGSLTKSGVGVVDLHAAL